MTFFPRLSDVRFGCGLSPRLDPPDSVAEVLARLTGPDTAAAAHPVEGWSVFQKRTERFRAVAEAGKRPGATKAEQRKRGQMWQEARRDALVWLAQSLLRRSTTQDGFRERLTAFWADHFTVVGRRQLRRFGAAPYVEESIRPHVAGRFGDMLKAVAVAPMMLRYLDQDRSVGPQSVVARRRGGGNNENLAREMLELHTLGVGADYAQADVIALAELLAGLMVTAEEGFIFRPGATQPGAERVLGVSYGADGPGRLEDVMAALDDLARHPATAGHIARKLAVHFVADEPDPALVEAMATAYRESDGDLVPVYRAMLEHPAAWAGPGTIKTPEDFVGSALRALDVRALPVRQHRKLEMLLAEPLEMMGQPWHRPMGPDGWPEADDDWITPQRLAGRLQWALNVPGVLVDRLPDPRAFAGAVLPGAVPEALAFAAKAAETRGEGIALILASPAFQRLG